MLFITVTAAIALWPGFVSNSALALGCCSTVFSAVALVLSERSLAGLTEVGTMVDVTAGGSSWGDGETRRSCITIGRQVGMYLFFGFAGASLVFENFPFQLSATTTSMYQRGAPVPAHAGWLGVKLLVISLLGAARWAVVPFVVGSLLLEKNPVRTVLRASHVESLDHQVFCRHCRIPGFDHDSDSGDCVCVLRHAAYWRD